MVYNNTVPQGSAQIASTQGPILANFVFLQAAIGQEHNFDADDPTQTYHQFASMPNMSAPTLNGAVGGAYYVNANFPYFNSAGSFGNLSIQTGLFPQIMIQGTANLTGSASAVFTVTNGTIGTYYIFKSGSNTQATGQFTAFNNQIIPSANADNHMSITTSGLTLQAAVSVDAGTFTYVLTAWTP